MATFSKYILPAILGFLGIIFGVYLTSTFNHKDWEQRTTYEQNIKIFEQKLSLIERTSTINSKMPAASDLFNLYFPNLSNTVVNAEQKIALIEKLGEIRAELFSVMFLNQIYFGDSTRVKIYKYLGNEKSETWWNLPEENYNDIVETMVKELNTNPNPHSHSSYLQVPTTNTSNYLNLCVLIVAIAQLIFIIRQIRKSSDDIKTGIEKIETIAKNVEDGIKKDNTNRKDRDILCEISKSIIEFHTYVKNAILEGNIDDIENGESSELKQKYLFINQEILSLSTTLRAKNEILQILNIINRYTIEPHLCSQEIGKTLPSECLNIESFSQWLENLCNINATINDILTNNI